LRRGIIEPHLQKKYRGPAAIPFSGGGLPMLYFFVVVVRVPFNAACVAIVNGNEMTRNPFSRSS
jgi:hypothetical protein